MPPYDSAVDQRFSTSPHVTLMRLRMQQMAKLIAASAVRELSVAQRRPLHLVDIGGGPAMDAIDALILLAQPSRELLKRPIVIHVLDLDDTGAFFGQAALAELKRAGGQLHGFNIELRHQDYDWRATALLEELMQDLISRDAVIIATSEGGLFEYGSDEDIVANLVALRAGGRGARCVVGSVTRADELRRRMIAETRFKLFPRGIEGFRCGEGWLQDRGNTHYRVERSGRIATRAFVEGHRSVHRWRVAVSAVLGAAKQRP